MPFVAARRSPLALFQPLPILFDRIVRTTFEIDTLLPFLTSLLLSLFVDESLFSFLLSSSPSPSPLPFPPLDRQVHGTFFRIKLATTSSTRACLFLLWYKYASTLREEYSSRKFVARCCCVLKPPS